MDVRLQAGLEGGALMDVGCYAVNAARYLFGAEPVEVSAQQRVDPEFGVDTAFAGLLRFPGDCLALIDGSFDAAGTQRYEIAGAAGLIQVERAYLPGDGPATVHVVTSGQQRSEEISGANQYALEADHFARSVRSGRSSRRRRTAWPKRPSWRPSIALPTPARPCAWRKRAVGDALSAGMGP